MPKVLEPFRLFLGDEHANSPTSITSRTRVTNKAQQWLLETFDDVTKRAKAEAKGKEFGLNLGGDATDTEGREARNAAIELLQPLANIASSIYGVPGTPYHTGEDGEEDRSVYDALGAKCKQWYRLDVGGKILDWAHHGIAVSKYPWLEYNGMKSKLEQVYWRCLSEGKRPPDLIVRHHAHRSPGILEERKMKVAVCPCWKLPDDFGAKVSDGVPVSIGALAWWPMQNNRLEIWSYAVPEDIAFA